MGIQFYSCMCISSILTTTLFAELCLIAATLFEYIVYGILNSITQSSKNWLGDTLNIVCNMLQHLAQICVAQIPKDQCHQMYYNQSHVYILKNKFLVGSLQQYHHNVDFYYKKLGSDIKVINQQHELVLTSRAVIKIYLSWSRILT